MTKAEVHNFALLYFSNWLSLVHGQHVSAACANVGHLKILMVLSPPYSTMVSFILSTVTSITEIPPLEEIQLILNATSLFLILIHQNTKSTTGLNIYSILEERLKTD